MCAAILTWLQIAAIEQEQNELNNSYRAKVRVKARAKARVKVRVKARAKARAKLGLELGLGLGFLMAVGWNVVTPSLGSVCMYIQGRVCVCCACSVRIIVSMWCKN